MIASTHPEAERELVEGARHYKRKVNAGLAAAFITEYERVVAQLLLYPLFGSIWRAAAALSVAQVSLQRDLSRL